MRAAAARSPTSSPTSRAIRTRTARGDCLRGGMGAVLAATIASTIRRPFSCGSLRLVSVVAPAAAPRALSKSAGPRRERTSS